MNRMNAPILITTALLMTASWYGPAFHGRETASGAKFDMNRLTAAHKTLPFGTLLEVSRGDQSVRVVVNDRGPFIEGRDLDLSKAAAKALGMIDAGVDAVQVTVLRRGWPE